MKKLLVIGGSGALGRNVVNTFKNKTPYWKVMNIDFNINTAADLNFTCSTFCKNELNSIGKLEFLSDNIDCVVSTAGGWAGGDIQCDDIIESVEKMMKMNLYSAILGSHLAKKFLRENSLIVLVGSNAIKKQMNPGMLGYELSKNSVHHLSQLLISTNQLSKGTKLITILPDTLDTEANRLAMPTSDFSKWSSPKIIAETIKDWADSKNYPNENFFKV